MTHFDHLAVWVPDLAHKRILDIGSGRGDFLIDAASRGAVVRGIELNESYRRLALERAAQRGVSIEQVAGVAEQLPFADGSFDFINMGEVIEHVESPTAAMHEAYRVLAVNGQGYLSAPNRFGLRDQHYQLYGINWLPRHLADRLLVWLGKDKGADKSAGHQTLSEMHYYTWGGLVRMTREAGFEVQDIRDAQLRTRFGALYFLPRLVYLLLRALYFDSFHASLRKVSENTNSL